MLLPPSTYLLCTYGRELKAGSQSARRGSSPPKSIERQCERHALSYLTFGPVVALPASLHVKTSPSLKQNSSRSPPRLFANLHFLTLPFLLREFTSQHWICSCWELSDHPPWLQKTTKLVQVTLKVVAPHPKLDHVSYTSDATSPPLRIRRMVIARLLITPRDLLSCPHCSR